MLVTDIDGTIVDHGSRGEDIDIDHPVKVGIKNAQSLGKIVTIATGRNYHNAKFVIKAFGITDPVIVNGGARIINPVSDEVLWEKRLKREIAQKITKYVNDTRQDADLFIGFGQKEILFSDMVDDDLEDLIYLAFIDISDRAEADRLVKMVSTLPDVRAGFVPSPKSRGRFCVTVTDEEATKSHALNKLQDMLGVTVAETIALGDGHNDLPLFAASGLKVAVDNADPLLKAAADMVVPSFHEHGMLQVIDDYLIGTEGQKS